MRSGRMPTHTARGRAPHESACTRSASRMHDTRPARYTARHGRAAERDVERAGDVDGAAAFERTPMRAVAAHRRRAPRRRALHRCRPSRRLRHRAATCGCKCKRSDAALEVSVHKARGAALKRGSGLGGSLHVERVPTRALSRARPTFAGGSRARTGGGVSDARAGAGAAAAGWGTVPRRLEARAITGARACGATARTQARRTRSPGLHPATRTLMTWTPQSFGPSDVAQIAVFQKRTKIAHCHSHSANHRSIVTVRSPCEVDRASGNGLFIPALHACSAVV